MIKKLSLIYLATCLSISALPISEYPVVCFTPNRQCQSFILREINEAKESIRLQAYSFTDKAIAYALVEAASRGIDVKINLDQSNMNDGRSAKDILISNGVAVRIDSPSGIAHNKVIIIDKSRLITGSYNFSQNAYSRNVENMLILYSPSLCEAYIYNWNKRWEVSK
jgi:phospholipase D